MLTQLLGFAVLPILTRLYSPSDFALLALFNATVSILASFATYKFDWCIPNARNRASSAALFILGVIALVVCVLCVAAITLLGDTQLITSLVRAGSDATASLAPINQFLPFALLGVGLVSLLKGWHIRANELRHVSRSLVLQNVVRAVLGLLGGIVGLGAPGLIGAFTVSCWIGSVALVRSSDRLVTAVRGVTAKRARATLSVFGREAGWSTAVSLVNAVSLSLPLIMISSFYSVREAGWYSLMYTVAVGPIGLVTSALSQSYWAHAASLAKEGRFRDLNHHYLATTKRLALAATLVAAGCTVAPFVVGPVFGEAEWGGAGYVLLAMMPLLVGYMMFSPTNHLVVLKRQSMQMFADCSRIVMVVAAIFGSYTMGYGVVQAVFLSSLASLAGHILLFVIHLSEHWKHES